MRTNRWWLVLFISFLVIGCGGGKTYSLLVRYQPAKDFPTLKEKMGPTLGLAPFKDERRETLYIGYHSPYTGTSSYFKSNPFPLEMAITDTLSQALSRSGIKTVPLSGWDGKPESLKMIEPDSVLMIEIKNLWMEGKASAFRTTLHTRVHFVISLGVKRDGKVYTRNVEVEKEVTLARLNPVIAEQTMNQILTDIFDAFFSNPY